MKKTTDGIKAALGQAFDDMARGREEFSPELAYREVGTVTNVSTGIAKVAGLPGVGYEELVQFPGGLLGIAFNIDENDYNSSLEKRPTNFQYYNNNRLIDFN